MGLSPGLLTNKFYFLIFNKVWKHSKQIFLPIVENKLIKRTRSVYAKRCCIFDNLVVFLLHSFQKVLGKIIFTSIVHVLQRRVSKQIVLPIVENQLIKRTGFVYAKRCCIFDKFYEFPESSLKNYFYFSRLRLA